MLKAFWFGLTKSIWQISSLTFSSFIYHKTTAIYIVFKTISILLFGPVVLLIWLVYIPTIFLVGFTSFGHLHYRARASLGLHRPNLINATIILVSSLISIPFMILNFFVGILSNVSLILVNWLNMQESKKHAEEIGIRY